MFGIDDAVSAVSTIVGKVIDRAWPDPTEAAKAKLAMAQLQASGELAQLAAETDLVKGQLAVNTAEASNASVFVSGWRPFIGWVCGVALLTTFLFAPFATWGAALFGKTVVFPPLDMGTLMTLLLGMLGLAGARTAEKISGVARK